MRCPVSDFVTSVIEAQKEIHVGINDLDIVKAKAALDRRVQLIADYQRQTGFKVEVFVRATGKIEVRVTTP